MRVVVTGGAGYIGSLLTGRLLGAGHQVIVADRLLFGGDSLLPYFGFPTFRFHSLDVSEHDLSGVLRGADVVYHLAAIVGFPACDAAGDELAYRHNVEATRRVFEAGEREGVGRFIFASTYSNYGVAQDGDLVTENSPLRPRSLYARTKIAAEQYLLSRAADSRCAPVIARFTTLFGVSPRMRFDLLVNQFVLEALTQRRLVIFQRDYRRSFVHVGDVVRSLVLFAEAPVSSVRGEVFNVGSERGNHTKGEVAELIRELIPDVSIEYRDVSFDGDMRDVAVSCRKVAKRLGYRAKLSVAEGVREVRDAIVSGLIADPKAPRYRNHEPIV